MESEIKEGYLYAFSNTCMPGILKVGMTERTPEERLRDANRSDTWRPPAPYKLECAIKVNNPLKKENILHRILEKYVSRINPEREFFKISIEEIRLFFSLFDSEIYVIKNEEDWPVMNIEMGGTRKRNDWQDIEPCCLMPMNIFTKWSEKS